MMETTRTALLRATSSGFELFFMRRSGEAYGFPGGVAQDGEDGRVAAARTLFEDCGVILARDTGQAETLEVLTFGALRKKIRGGANATELIRSVGLTWASEAMMPWSHWVTPSIDTARSSTRVYIAEQPGGLPPQFDKTETVEQIWLRPADVAERASELLLPPMLVHTCYELAQYQTIAQVLAAARARAEEAHPILPRRSAQANAVLLLPWDPDYETSGQGDSQPLAFQPKWARGPSRLVLEDRTWKHVAAPGSTPAD